MILESLWIPISILIASIVLIAALKTFERMKGVDRESKEDRKYYGTNYFMGIEKDIEKESKEKLEKLRLALESEQVKQTVEYHAISMRQSRISFWFSIGAASVGFFIILMGSALALGGVQSATAVITIISGIVIDAVAALFFVQSNQARRLMTDFFDKLRDDRKFNESLRLCESIELPETKANIKANLSLYFAGVTSEPLLPKIKDIVGNVSQSESTNGIDDS